MPTFRAVSTSAGESTTPVLRMNDSCRLAQAQATGRIKVTAITGTKTAEYPVGAQDTFAILASQNLQ